MIKKRLTLGLAAILLAVNVAACGSPAVSNTSSTAVQTEMAVSSTAAADVADRVHLTRTDWADDVKTALNDFLDLYGEGSDHYEENSYVVFDFDNTCSIFDVEEQTAVFQLQTMAFDFTPEELPDILSTGIGDKDEDRSDAGYGEGSYQDWIDDITAAYSYLYDTYGPFTAEGLSEDAQEQVQSDPEWLEFAAKMRAMYDLISDCESASVSYPWVLYWFSGMTEDEVYDLATRCFDHYRNVDSSEETWTSPETIESHTGVVEISWTSGVQVTENIQELMKALQANGIQVWVCSASLTDTVRAAIDEWGLHDYVNGLLAMTVKTDSDGAYTNEYDFENGCGWLAKAGGEWTRDDQPIKAQTQGAGKVTAIENAIAARYKQGPIAGFMDSTGDFNFCTEYDSLKLVVVFNRASRKVTDGGGLAAEVAIYERDTLGYDLKSALEAGDTFYVLQGRDENGVRTLRESNATLTLGSTEEKLFKNEDNEAQLQYMIDNGMSVTDIFDTFAIKTAEDDSNNVLGFKYGFLEQYDGYHSRGT